MNVIVHVALDGKPSRRVAWFPPRAAGRVSVVLCAVATLAACASTAHISPFIAGDGPEGIVCKDTEIQLCERLSAFQWSRCECADSGTSRIRTFSNGQVGGFVLR